MRDKNYITKVNESKESKTEKQTNEVKLDEAKIVEICTKIVDEKLGKVNESYSDEQFDAAGRYLAKKLQEVQNAWADEYALKGEDSQGGIGREALIRCINSLVLKLKDPGITKFAR